MDNDKHVFFLPVPISIHLSVMEGVKGSKGQKGGPGDMGPIGDMGFKGSKGDMGIMGVKGDLGPGGRKYHICYHAGRISDALSQAGLVNKETKVIRGTWGQWETRGK